MRIAFVAICLLCMASIVHAGDAFPLASDKTKADIYFDPHDARVVEITAGLLADDVQRVTGQRPALRNDPAQSAENAVIVGTIGQSAMIDQLIAAGKLNVADVKGQWESYVRQVVDDPTANIKHALVIAGSDRRGTAYGILDLSRQIGISPWYWWADVTPAKQTTLNISSDRVVSASPKVKYRGIFLNDEDFGLRPWASKTFDPQAGNLGPRTYAKIFELLLRLKMNYIWPAMHPGSAEFSTFPGNSETADQWAIVTGSSHCEPMLRNNVYWPKSNGQWRYDVNRDAIFNYWKESAINRGNFEAVWTLGIRGIHDSAMSGPKELPARVKMVEGIFTDQRSLIDQYVTKKYGPVAQCFVPYKEVLPLYNAGLAVPGDVTLVWPDDNYGYVRRLATPAERLRSGGSGVYYHVSYWGSPHSYLWVESTPPGLMWEELRKTYDNDSKTIWIVNVGDLKPAEVAIDFFAKLALDPTAWNADAQAKFLPQFDAEAFGSAGEKVAQLQADYYRLASIRKPEHVGYDFVDSLSPAQSTEMVKRYQGLLDEEKSVAQLIPADRADAYFETVGYAVRMLCASGLLYQGDEATARAQKKYIDQQTAIYNDKIAGGKWHGMMSETMEGLSWPAEVGGKAKPVERATSRPADVALTTIDVADFQSQTTATSAGWQSVAGLGWSGRAMTIEPATKQSHWELDQIGSAPSMEYPFQVTKAGDVQIMIQALPTIRLTPTGKLRIAASIDGAAPVALDVPGGDADSETSKQRRSSVISNRTTIHFDAGELPGGTHRLKVFAMDAGVVLDQIDFPQCQTVTPVKQPSVRFESFSYAGKDSVADQLPVGPTQFRNPILAGFYPDPSICRVGGDFYLVNSTFAYFPCIPIWHSTDLVHWKQLGNVIDRASQVGSMQGLSMSSGMYAPTIRYHAGKFYVICTLIGSKGNFFVTATNPAGPWSDPIWLTDIGGIDPSFFFDDSGYAFVIHNDGPPDNKALYDGHRTIRMRRVDLQTGKAIGESHLLINGGTNIEKHPVWIEGPHLFHHNGFYYLIAAEGGTEPSHSEVVFRSKEMWGPYVPGPSNPILTQRDLPPDRNHPITCAGHADFVELSNGDWWSVFLGCRPYENGMFNTGRETFLHPVQWVDGWPIILPHGKELPYVLPSPVLPAETNPTEPTAGSFIWKDSFEDSALGPSWLFIRTPVDPWYELHHGLLIQPRPIDLSSKDNPSFIGHRQQHATFSASVQITIDPASPDCDAGLAAFQNEGHWFFLGFDTATKKLFLEEMNASEADLKLNHSPTRLASASLPTSLKTLDLKITGAGQLYSFSYKSANGWVELKRDVDGSILSTVTAGGFQGATIGMFARTSIKDPANH